MNNQAGKGDKVANNFRTPQWENSKLWANIEKKAKNERIFRENEHLVEESNIEILEGESLSNMQHIQICKNDNCELCEDLLLDGLVWSCDHCQSLGNADDKCEGGEGEVICYPCYDKHKQDNPRKLIKRSRKNEKIIML